MKPQYIVILAVCAVILIGVFIWTSGGGPPEPSSLTSKALKGGTEADRADAARQLAMLKGPKATVELRRLVTESQEGEVVVIALGGLEAIGDQESFPLFIKALDNPDKSVRIVAYKAVQKRFNPLPEKLVYDVDAAPDKRAQVASKLQEIYKKLVEMKPEERKSK